MATHEKFDGPDCEAGALEGVRAVLRVRLEEMCDLRADALRWEDIEGVHKMRVASRRLRSALRDFENVLGDDAIPLRRLKAVADALGEVRDQDVAIAARFISCFRADPAAIVRKSCYTGVTGTEVICRT